MSEINNLISDIKNKRGFNDFVFQTIREQWSEKNETLKLSSKLLGYIKDDGEPADDIDYVDIVHIIEDKFEIMVDVDFVCDIETVKELCIKVNDLISKKDSEI